MIIGPIPLPTNGMKVLKISGMPSVRPPRTWIVWPLPALRAKGVERDQGRRPGTSTTAGRRRCPG